jgi:hypothetical protein
VCTRGRRVRHFLQVVRKNDRRYPPLTYRDPNTPIDQVAHLRWRRRLLDKSTGDVLQKTHQVDFLLVMAPERIARLLPAYSQERHVPSSSTPLLTQVNA